MSDKKDTPPQEEKPKPNPNADRPKISFVLNHATPTKKK